MSRLVNIDPTSRLDPEPKGLEFGELKVDNEEVNEVEVQQGKGDLTKETTRTNKFIISVKEEDEGPIPELQLTWNMPDKDIAKVQRQDTFCMKVIEEIQK